MGDLRQYRHSVTTEEAIGIIYYIQQSEIDTGSELGGSHSSFVSVEYEPEFGKCCHTLVL